MIDIVTKINNMMFEGAPLWDVIDACSVIDIESCFDPIFEPPLDFLEECRKRQEAAQSPFHTTIERKIGNREWLFSADPTLFPPFSVGQLTVPLCMNSY